MKSSYEELEKKLAESQREFRAADATIENLQMQLEKLAAENAALKSFGDKLSEMHNDLNGEGTGIQGRAEVACQQIALEAAMEEFDAIKTPATDASLTEVRAQGIESGIDMLIAIMNHQHPAASQAIDILRIHAEHLRKGVQS